MIPLLLGLAWGALPPPDYDATLVGALSSRLDTLLQAGEAEQALQLARSFRREVTDAPVLAYDQALALRLLGRDPEALPLLEAAVARDPELAGAWYDLGEIRLVQGRLGAASTAFREAANRTEDHPKGWAGPWRLAEIAATQDRPGDFERWLREALRRGFSLRTVAADPRWHRFAADPQLGPILDRLAEIYGESANIDELR